MSTIKSSSANLTLNADGANNDIKFQSNGTEKASIDQDGNLVLSGTLTSLGVDDNCTATKLTVSDSGININGDITFSSASQGICLGVTSNTDANTLDDYEEGTWTPVWTSEGGTLNTNTTYTRGAYTKVGRQVTVYARLYTNSVSSPTGVITISGLPFTINGTNDTQGAYTLFRIGAITGTLSGTPVALPMGGTATLKVIDKIWDSTQSTGDIADHLDNDAWAHVRLTYFV